MNHQTSSKVCLYHDQKSLDLSFAPCRTMNIMICHYSSKLALKMRSPAIYGDSWGKIMSQIFVKDRELKFNRLFFSLLEKFSNFISISNPSASLPDKEKKSNLLLAISLCGPGKIVLFQWTRLKIFVNETSQIQISERLMLFFCFLTKKKKTFPAIIGWLEISTFFGMHYMHTRRQKTRYRKTEH